MTHLSDFSYLQRCALEIYMGLFLIYRIWSNDRFRCLHPKRIFAGELRSIITVLYIMMLLMQASWDVVSTWIKYNEKFMVIPGTDHIISKPFTYWTNQHQEIAQAMDYVECVNLSMQTGVFFLLQCFWNYLSNAVAKKTFMSSWEFKFYIFWALGSVAIFPILQWYFRKDINMRETAPQLAYSIEVLITSALGIRSHRRFKRILNISSNLKHGAVQIVEKLAYFKDMNIYMTIVLFFYGSGLLIICVDGLTDAKLINSNKFAADLLIANCNIASVLIWIVGISIFHPRRANSELESTIDSRSITTATTQNHRYNQGGDIEISNNKTHHQGSSTFSDGGMKFNNNNRLSQRITNFIESKNGTLRFAPDDLNTSSAHYEPTAKELMNSSQGHFLRPMSPVEVDYPSVVDNDRSFTPTSHQYLSSPSSPVESKTAMFSNRGMAVDDSYMNNAMAEQSAKSKKYNQHRAGRDSYEDSYRSISPVKQEQHYPLQTMSGAISTRHDDFKFDPSMTGDNTFDYLQSPTKAKTNNNSYF